MTPLFPLPDFSGLQAPAQIPSFFPCIPLPRSGPRLRLFALSQFDFLILNPFFPTFPPVLLLEVLPLKGLWKGAKARILSQTLGLQFTRPGSLAPGQQLCTVW